MPIKDDLRTNVVIEIVDSFEYYDNMIYFDRYLRDELNAHLENLEHHMRRYLI
jgi:hypothetical protein